MQNLWDFVLRSNPLVVVIAAAEIAFWLVIVLGLLFRYPFRMKRAGAAILFSVPLIDLVLLVATSIDLENGSKATEVHGLAAAYLGFSVAFGPSMVSWLDAKFAYQFAGGPKPPKTPRLGDPERTRRDWREWRRVALAWAIACGAMLVMIFVVSTPEDTRAMWVSWIPRLTVIGIAWFFFGPVWAWSYEKFDPKSHRNETRT